MTRGRGGRARTRLVCTQPLSSLPHFSPLHTHFCPPLSIPPKEGLRLGAPPPPACASCLWALLLPHPSGAGTMAAVLQAARAPLPLTPMTAPPRLRPAAAAYPSHHHLPQTSVRPPSTIHAPVCLPKLRRAAPAGLAPPRPAGNNACLSVCVLPSSPLPTPLPVVLLPPYPSLHARLSCPVGIPISPQSRPRARRRASGSSGCPVLPGPALPSSCFLLFVLLLAGRRSLLAPLAFVFVCKEGPPELYTYACQPHTLPHNTSSFLSVCFATLPPAGALRPPASFTLFRAPPPLHTSQHALRCFPREPAEDPPSCGAASLASAPAGRSI